MQLHNHHMIWIALDRAAGEMLICVAAMHKMHAAALANPCYSDHNSLNSETILEVARGVTKHTRGGGGADNHTHKALYRTHHQSVAPVIAKYLGSIMKVEHLRHTQHNHDQGT